MSRDFSREIDDYVKNSPKDKHDAIIDWASSVTSLIVGERIVKIAASIASRPFFLDQA